MEDDQQFCLRWNNHQSTLISVFDTLLENGTLVDCTLAAEGKFLKAHKVVLSACSPYFATLLTQQYDKHPVFILKDVKFQELRAMMDYMYRGEVNISQDQLAALLRAAESLQIKGLSDNRGGGGGGGGSSSSGGDSGSKSENAQKPIPVPVVSKPGLTIEQKRPNKHPAIDADLCESREGSTSPTSRKRKKIRRRSTETNNLVDNHDQLSNSSSQSMPHHHQQQQQQQQTKHMTSSVAPLPQITSATSAANVLNVTKKTDIHEPKKELDQSMQQEVADDDDDDDDQNEVQEQPVRRMKTQHHDIDMSHLKEKMESTHSELLIEPKSEYDDGNDETVEDLTLDEEELLEDLDQAGPSHGGEGSSQGYAQWQVDRSQDEVFLAAQEAAGQHRDAQGKLLSSSKKGIKTTTLPSNKLPSLPVISNEKKPIASTSSSFSKQQQKERKLSHPRIKYSGVKNLTGNSGGGVVNNMSSSNTSSVIGPIGIGKTVGGSSSSVVSIGSGKILNSGGSISSRGGLMGGASIGVSSIGGSNIGSSCIGINSSGTNNSTNSAVSHSTSTNNAAISHLASISNIANINNIAGIINATAIGGASNIGKVPSVINTSSSTGSTSSITSNSASDSSSACSKTESVNPPSIPNISVPLPPPLKPAPNLMNKGNLPPNTPTIDEFVKYADIDDIELPDGTKIGYPSDLVELKRLQSVPNFFSHDNVVDKISTMKQLSMLAAAKAIHDMSDIDVNLNQSNNEEMEIYACRHCGKKYRWKSTLRRHENDECGGKEPAHICPYCPYKAKQRGNLGVHVRKHHADMPQLESRRKKRSSF